MQKRKKSTNKKYRSIICKSCRNQDLSSHLVFLRFFITLIEKSSEIFILSLFACESYTFWYLHRYSSLHIWLYGRSDDRYQ